MFGSICPPHKKPPLIRTPPLGGTIIVTINLDGGTITPLIRNDFWSNLPPILKIGGFVVDRKSIDLLTKSVRKASEIWFLVKTLKKDISKRLWGGGHFIRGGKGWGTQPTITPLIRNPPTKSNYKGGGFLLGGRLYIYIYIYIYTCLEERGAP